MTTVGERIDQLMREANIGENELSRRSRVSQSTIHRIRTGQSLSPRESNLRAIGKALGGYSIAQLVGDAPLDSGPSSQPAEDPIANYTLVPRYNVTAGLGDGEVFQSEQVIDELAFRTAWLRARGLQPDKIAVIACRGDSMTPTIRDGDVALVDLRDRDLRRDGIYAIRRDGHGAEYAEIIVKRIQTTLAGTIRIISDNEDYPPEEYAAGQAPEIAVVGRVVWAGGDVR